MPAAWARASTSPPRASRQARICSAASRPDPPADRGRRRRNGSRALAAMSRIARLHRPSARPTSVDCSPVGSVRGGPGGARRSLGSFGQRSSSDPPNRLAQSVLVTYSVKVWPGHGHFVNGACDPRPAGRGDAPTWSRHARRTLTRRPPRTPCGRGVGGIRRRRPERATSPCRAAALMAPSPGACWSACSRPDPDRRHQRRLGGRAECRRLASGWLRGGGAGAAQASTSCGAKSAPRPDEPAARRRARPRWPRISPRSSCRPISSIRWGLNPLRPVLERLVDFERLRAAAATPVHRRDQCRNRRARIFRNAELSIDAVLASACLPQLHPAITIDGEPYWDGGFSANPPLLALVEGSGARDVVLVQINPMAAERMPRTPREIRNRVAEIAFGRPLAEELERLRHRAGRGSRRCRGSARSAAPGPASPAHDRRQRRAFRARPPHQGGSDMATAARAARARLDGRGDVAAPAWRRPRPTPASG